MKKLVVFGAVVAVAGMVLAAPASANHSWGKYHWAHTARAFSLTLGDNTRSDRVVTNWSSLLSTTSNDWNNPNQLGPSTVLHTTVGTGDAGRDCGAVLGKVEVCSADYGANGWLGVAQIWLYRGGSHIAQGTVQLNDYYYKSGSARYNNTADQLHTICQEVGHTFGLDHQSTSGASLDTCMDYYDNVNSSDTKSTRPNAGDFGELSCIYDPAYYRVRVSTVVSTPYANYTHTCRGTGHLDSFDSAGARAAASSRSSYFPHAKPSFAPGTKVAKDEYVDQLPNGGKLVTFVTPPNG